MPDTWSHTFDFTQSNGEWSPIPYQGYGPAWQLGQGWRSAEYQTGSGWNNISGIRIDFPLSTISSVRVIYSATTGQGPGLGQRGIYYNDPGYAGTLYGGLQTGSGDFDTTITSTQNNVSSIAVYVDSADVTQGNVSTIKSVTIEGTGCNPFQTDSAQWSRTFDFRQSSHGWSAIPYEAHQPVWNANEGWNSTNYLTSSPPARSYVNGIRLNLRAQISLL